MLLGGTVLLLALAVAVVPAPAPAAENTEQPAERTQRANPFSEFAIPTSNSRPGGIVAGPDGAMWFTEFTGDKVGRVTTDGDLREFAVPTAASEPLGIAAGPDGAVWFTEQRGNNIGRVTTGGNVTEFPIPTAGSQPHRIVVGPDEALWFTEFTGNKIGRIATDGSFSEFPVPTPNSGPFGLAAGPDGALWFTEQLTNKIGRIATDGSFKEFPVPTTGSHPADIVAGPDGALWFTEHLSNKIGRVTTAGGFSEFPIPQGNTRPVWIVADQDDSLWFAEYPGNRIWQVTTDGSFSEFDIPTANSGPTGLAVGPDGGLWFTEQLGNKVGRFSEPPPLKWEFKLKLDLVFDPPSKEPDCEFGGATTVCTVFDSPEPGQRVTGTVEHTGRGLKGKVELLCDVNLIRVKMTLETVPGQKAKVLDYEGEVSFSCTYHMDFGEDGSLTGTMEGVVEENLIKDSSPQQLLGEGDLRGSVVAGTGEFEDLIGTAEWHERSTHPFIVRGLPDIPAFTCPGGPGDVPPGGGPGDVPPGTSSQAPSEPPADAPPGSSPPDCPAPGDGGPPGGGGGSGDVPPPGNASAKRRKRTRPDGSFRLRLRKGRPRAAFAVSRSVALNDRRKLRVAAPPGSRCEASASRKSRRVSLGRGLDPDRDGLISFRTVLTKRLSKGTWRLSATCSRRRKVGGREITRASDRVLIRAVRKVRKKKR